MCPGTILVPICAWASFWCLCENRHLFRSQMLPRTIWCPYVPGYHSCEDMFPEILWGHNVLINPSGTNMCPGTFLVPICARARFWCPYLPRHYFGALIYPVPICARAPFWCQYVLVHPSGSQMCPGTIPVLICTRAPFRCPHMRGTILLPICAQAPIQCQYSMGTISLPKYAWVSFWCLYMFPDVPGLSSGAHMCLGTISVPVRDPTPF